MGKPTMLVKKQTIIMQPFGVCVAPTTNKNPIFSAVEEA